MAHSVTVDWHQHLFYLKLIDYLSSYNLPAVCKTNNLHWLQHLNWKRANLQMSIQPFKRCKLGAAVSSKTPICTHAHLASSHLYRPITQLSRLICVQASGANVRIRMMFDLMSSKCSEILKVFLTTIYQTPVLLTFFALRFIICKVCSVSTASFASAVNKIFTRMSVTGFHVPQQQMCILKLLWAILYSAPIFKTIWANSIWKPVVYIQVFSFSTITCLSKGPGR